MENPHCTFHPFARTASLRGSWAFGSSAAATTVRHPARNANHSQPLFRIGNLRFKEDERTFSVGICRLAANIAPTACMATPGNGREEMESVG